MSPADRPLLVATVPLAAVAVMIANDHVLKWQLDNWWTGKLSDVAGLVFFPLLVLALLEWVGCRPLRTRSHVAIAALATAIGFAAIKLWPPANALYSWLAGVLQLPAHAIVAWLRGEATPSVRPVDCVLDPTDLLALPALVVPLLAARRTARPDRGSARDDVQREREIALAAGERRVGHVDHELVGAAGR